MGILGLTVRRALDRAHRTSSQVTRVGRWSLALAISTGLIVSTLGSSTTVQAGPPPDLKASGGKAIQGTVQADLMIREIRINGQVPDGKDDCTVGKNTVSVVVRNAGPGDAGAFNVRLIVDVEARDEMIDGLGAGQEREVRFDGVALKKGAHIFKAVVGLDPAGTDPNRRNDELKIAVVCTGS